MRIRLSFIVILVFLLAACGPAATPEPTETPAAPEPTETPAQVQEGEAETSGPPTDFQGVDYTTTDSGLQVAITDEGDGEQPETGDVVSVHYTGMLDDGTIFDSSRNRGEPFRFPLGRGRVIPGWDEGVSLLREGGTAKLIIPPDLAYGEAGSGGVIPPDATLYFDVELVGISAGGPDEPETVDDADYEETESGLQYYVLTEGDGEQPESGQPVSVHFTAWLDDGTRIDSSIDAGEPVTFILGSEQVFPGWNEAVMEMQVGGEWQVILPPDLALGEEGAGEVIPPNSTLVMQLELLEILPSGPEEPTEVEADEYTETDSGVRYVDLEEGSGDAVADGDAVVVHYTGWLEDGTRFDTSYGRGEPFTVVVGAGQVIPGWEEGLTGMTVGSVRQIVIPPDQAYGEEGAGDVIPPGATLTFEVELLEITQPQN